MGINPENNEHSAENVNQITKQLSTKKYIRCPECGEEILMVPTLGEMIEEINHHVSTHKKQPNVEVPMVHLKASNICMELTKQVLERAAEMIDSDVTDARQKPSLWL